MAKKENSSQVCTVKGLVEETAWDKLFGQRENFSPFKRGPVLEKAVQVDRAFSKVLKFRTH